MYRALSRVRYILLYDKSVSYSCREPIFYNEHVFFWLVYTLYAYALKDFHKINKHALVIAGILGVFIPFLNGIQSELWFWKSFQSGHIDSFFIDISWLFLGMITLTTAFSIRRLVPKSKSEKLEVQTAVPEKANNINPDQSTKITTFKKNVRSLTTIFKLNQIPMKTPIKIAIIWLIIAMGLAMHAALEALEYLFYHPLPEAPYHEGVPTDAHIIYLIAMIFPMIIAFLSLFYRQKGFKIFSFVYAIILCLLNVFHAVETVMAGLDNLSQVVLLLFVAIANIILVRVLNIWRKEA